MDSTTLASSSQNETSVVSDTTSCEKTYPSFIHALTDMARIRRRKTLSELRTEVIDKFGSNDEALSEEQFKTRVLVAKFNRGLRPEEVEIVSQYRDSNPYVPNKRKNTQPKQHNNRQQNYNNIVPNQLYSNYEGYQNVPMVRNQYYQVPFYQNVSTVSNQIQPQKFQPLSNQIQPQTFQHQLFPQQQQQQQIYPLFPQQQQQQQTFPPPLFPQQQMNHYSKHQMEQANNQVTTQGHKHNYSRKYNKKNNNSQNQSQSQSQNTKESS